MVKENDVEHIHNSIIDKCILEFPKHINFDLLKNKKAEIVELIKKDFRKHFPRNNDISLDIEANMFCIQCFLHACGLEEKHIIDIMVFAGNEYYRHVENMNFCSIDYGSVEYSSKILKDLKEKYFKIISERTATI